MVGFFFLTQFVQGAHGFSPLQAGLGFGRLSAPCIAGTRKDDAGALLQGRFSAKRAGAQRSCAAPVGADSSFVTMVVNGEETLGTVEGHPLT
ncbi:MAG: hypothetical protein ACX93U_14020 [Salipiger thiooxidans]|uniref:hypothetical protein n=1 Tax=Salipiger thiooxidans TaxID=282683 RepID=UPI001CF9FDEE|nr:hypothetical protein [Salipiger thiooxidans]